MVLADGEDDGLAHLTADGITQGVFEEGLAEDLVRGGREELLLKLADAIDLLVVALRLCAFLFRSTDDITRIRQQLRGHFRAAIHHGRIDEEAVLHAIEQRVAIRGVAFLAAEGAVGVQHETALILTRVFAMGLFLVEILEVITRCGGEAELVTDEVIKHRPGIAADAAVGFVGDDEIEVGG
jgi:hypothetical protein